MQRHRPISMEEGERKRFIIIKKLVALALLATFAGIGIYTTWKWLAGLQTEPPFEAFYTILIFTDVHRCVDRARGFPLQLELRSGLSRPPSGFAAATVLMRLALSAPGLINGALGLGAILFAVALTAAYNHFSNATESPGGPAPLDR